MICFFIHGGKHVLIDNEDYQIASLFSWHLNINGYASTSIKSMDKNVYTVPMHRLIMGLNVKDGIQVDHIDGDRGNNTRNNLRVCMKHENAKNRLKNKNNTTGFKGVHFFEGKYVAQVYANKKRIYLGRFDSAEQAHKAYCDAAKIHYGDFASGDFI